MDGRQGSEETSGRGGRAARGPWRAYLVTAGALAVFRVSVLAWTEYRYLSQRDLQIVYSADRLLEPEILLSGYTRVGMIHFETMTSHFAFWASLLLIGSFIIATPVLLIGWLRASRR
jgi:hypothetical protein